MIVTSRFVTHNLRSYLQPSFNVQARQDLLNNLKTKSNIRCMTTTETGAILSEPKVTSFGLLKMLGAVVPGLYVGSSISRLGAAWLEENDIFVPSDDDDDDD